MLSDGRAIRIGSPFELCCPHLFDTPIETKTGDRHRRKAKAIWIRFTNISITYFWLVSIVFRKNGADGGTLNPHLAYGELIKLLSAPFGRYRYIISSLSRSLNAFLSPTHFIKKKSLCFAQAFLFWWKRRGSEPLPSTARHCKPLSAPVGRYRSSASFLPAA